MIESGPVVDNAFNVLKYRIGDLPSVGLFF